MFRSTAETSLEVKWRERNPFDKIRVGLNEAKESGSELIRLAQLNLNKFTKTCFLELVDMKHLRGHKLTHFKFGSQLG